MIRINLLPVRAARKKENVRWQISVFFLMILFGLVVMAYIALNMSRNISNMTAKIEAAESELKELQAISKQVQDIKKNLKKLQAKMDVIQTLETGRMKSVLLLDSLTGLVISDRMWLTSLAETRGQVELKGMATDNKTVADFMKRLEESPYYNEVSLISSRQVQERQIAGKFKEFTIICQTRMPTTQEETKAS